MHIEWPLAQRDRWGSPISFSGAAEKLNGEQLPSPMGRRWSWRTVREIAFRLGFSDRVAYVRADELQARVDVAFNIPAGPLRSSSQNAGSNTQWASCGRARRRGALANRRRGITGCRGPSRPVDRYTVTRTGISKMWKRHPEWSAREVIERGPPKWV